MFDLFSAILSIVLIDLVLSGDNAVIIGMAARRLSPENRRRAIIFGGAGAIGLRVLFTVMAAFLLAVPYLRAVGGLLLLWIAYKLLRPQAHDADVSEAGSLGEAIRTIILADVVMSLDNILAVAGVATSASGEAGHTDMRLLLFGLLLSIPILLVGSELVARVLGRFPILVYVGAFVLILAAVGMVLEDNVVRQVYHPTRLETWGITAVATALIIGVGLLAQRTKPAPTPLVGCEGSLSEDGRRPGSAEAAPRQPVILVGQVDESGSTGPA